eukprot:TRINITY_DN14061_c0_g1_i1.p1 TRINITY_DN14061_c0_g1~~TRINITY_DN14061_c0_g1_i1.p1  ORF type:complete len:581 (+),score=101.89 TRINITY_DN14061_c0_g1_i1:107-1849(+)
MRHADPSAAAGVAARAPPDSRRRRASAGDPPGGAPQRDTITQRKEQGGAADPQEPRHCDSPPSEHAAPQQPAAALRRTAAEANAEPALPAAATGAAAVGEHARREPGLCRDEGLFISTIDEEHLCSIGRGVLVNPVMTPCQHEFCAKCIQESLRHKSECPICRQPLTQDDVRTALKTTSLVGKLMTHCDNWHAGCSWTGKWADTDAHRESCPYEPVRCPFLGCTGAPQRNALQLHVSECAFRPTPCHYCAKEVPGCDVEAHEANCPDVPVECPQRCSDPGITRESLEAHIRDSCPFTLVACPFQQLGCAAGQMQRVALAAHMTESTETHLLSLCNKVREQHDTIWRQQATIQKLLRRSLIVVDPSGRGTFTTIQAAVDNAEAGDRITVRPGLYRECLNLPPGVSLQADGAQSDVIIENGHDANVIVIRDACSISGFTLRQRSRNFFCLRIIASGDGVVVEGCDIQSDHFSCVQIDSGANPLVRNNRVHDSKQCGIIVKRNGAGRIECNEIFSNSLSNVYIDAGANPTVRHNQIHSSQQHGIWLKQAACGVISNNTIYNNQMNNIKIEDGATPTIRKNVAS